MNAHIMPHALVLAASLATTSIATHAADALPTPKHVSGAVGTDGGPTLLAARRYAAFWNTGDPRFARSALSPDFVDRTLPTGRPQGIAGPLAASSGFRAAVPDLTAEMEHVVIAGDYVSVHLRFRGHFTGRMGDVAGGGQAIEFQAFDLYRLENGLIAENWHLEDNLTLERQLGLIAR